MTIEKFLSFWNSYNIQIIEGLLAVIVLVSLVQAFRLFLGKKSDHDDGVAGSSLDAAQIEKTLQKILDAQKHSGSSLSPAMRTEGIAQSDEMAINIDLGQADSGSAAAIAALEAKAAAQVAQLQQQVEAQKKEVLQLQEQLKAAASAPAGAPTDTGGASAAELAASKAEKDALAEKIKDLEARLAEYEIISEDIADLSRYREENEALKAEIEKLKAGGASLTLTPAAQTSEPVAPAVEVESPASSAPTVAVAAEPVSPVAAAEAAEMAADQATADTAASAELIDDELMREFAAAVEGQKNLTQASEKAATAEEKKQGDETEKLMGEFENFVNKKS